MIYDIFISFVVVVWLLSGMGIFAILAEAPSRHAEGPAVILFYLLPAYVCAMMGPFTGIFWIIKKLVQRFG